MEYLAGRGLRDFLTLRLRLGLKDTMSIMSQLLAALDFAHANGVVHRDVKPANIIMLLSGRLKLADFGIALVDSFDLAQAGAAAGTPAYMSPEQHFGLEADRRSDIFSCGVVLYELLTGGKPFEGPSDAVGQKICHEPYPPASEVKPQGSPAVLDGVIAKALAKDPAARFPTAREFAGALDAAFKETSDYARKSESEATTVRAPQPGEPFPALRLTTEGLRAVEVLLTIQVGPMAKLLMKQSAKAATDGPTLVSLVSKYIPAEANRKAFIAAAMEKVSAAVIREDVEQGPTVHFSRNLVDATEIEIAAKLLARYMGP